MIKRERGRVQAGAIVFPEPLDLPDGTEVSVSIEPLTDTGQSSDASDGSDFGSLPFFGMWADREDMQDSTAWVRQERRRWQRRAVRQD